MKNFEKWEREILDIIQKNHDVALLHNKPVSCGSIKCTDCGFFCNDCSCNIQGTRWLYAEYVEKPKLTKQERKFCELFEGKSYYIARDKDGVCYGYFEKPTKDIEKNRWDGEGSWFGISGVLEYANIKFDFIKWEDEKPWAIDDLLKLDVADN